MVIEAKWRVQTTPIKNYGSNQRGLQELRSLRSSVNYDNKRGRIVLMNLRLLSWNVRRLNDRDRRLEIRNLLRMWKADVVSSRNKNGGH